MKTLALQDVPEGMNCPLCGHDSSSFHTGLGPGKKIRLIWCDYLIVPGSRNRRSAWCGCGYFYDCILEEDTR